MNISVLGFQRKPNISMFKFAELCYLGLRTLVKGGVESNVTLSWENKTKFLTRTSAAHEQSEGRRSGRAWWRGGDGGRRPGRGPGDAECQRVSHFCGAVARARAAQAAARVRADSVDWAMGGRHCACPCSLHRQRRAPILGSPCSPDFSGAFSRFSTKTVVIATAVSNCISWG